MKLRLAASNSLCNTDDMEKEEEREEAGGEIYLHTQTQNREYMVTIVKCEFLSAKCQIELNSQMELK